MKDVRFDSSGFKKIWRKGIFPFLNNLKSHIFLDFQGIANFGLFNKKTKNMRNLMKRAYDCLL